MAAVRLLASFAEALNPILGKQMRMAAPLARQVAEVFGLDEAQLDQIETAASIHDMGLLSLPKELQNKDVKLMTEEQYRMYCEHPIIASITLEGDDALVGAGEIVLYHHEQMNGKGFPNGLAGDQIPIGSRIILAVSDYCRILTTWPRDMRKLLNYARRHLDADDWKRFTFSENSEAIIEESAVKILLKDTEKKYDAAIVKALIRVVHKNKNIDPADMVEVEALESGMVLMDDLRLDGGRLLLTKGTKLESKTIASLQNMEMRGVIPHTLYVSVPDA
jgi:response regulator RpfG family c-di-GMP phosphodiesterase